MSTQSLPQCVSINKVGLLVQGRQQPHHYDGGGKCLSSDLSCRLRSLSALAACLRTPTRLARSNI